MQLTCITLVREHASCRTNIKGNQYNAGLTLKLPSIDNIILALIYMALL